MRTAGRAREIPIHGAAQLLAQRKSGPGPAWRCALPAQRLPSGARKNHQRARRQPAQTPRPPRRPALQQVDAPSGRGVETAPERHSQRRNPVVQQEAENREAGETLNDSRATPCTARLACGNSQRRSKVYARVRTPHPSAQRATPRSQRRGSTAGTRSTPNRRRDRKHTRCAGSTSRAG